MNPIVFITTGAHNIPSADITLLRERYIEYRIGLQKVALYNKPMYGVLSEYDVQAPEIPPFELYCKAGLIRLPPNVLSSARTKSQKEFLSIQLLLDTFDMPEDTFVIKISGRYILMKDSFFDAVESVRDDPTIQGVICMTPDNQQQYTFLFALRWKWFRKFYSKSVEELGTKNVEQFIVEFYKEEKILSSLKRVERLDIFTQISNASQFQLL